MESDKIIVLEIEYKLYYHWVR